MIVDPVQALMPTLTMTASQILPTHTPTSVDPLPTAVDPSVEFQHVTKDGLITLWVVFAIMVISSALFAGWALRVPVSNRLFHVITTIITVTAAISYFAMATGQGISVHHVGTRHESNEHVPDTETQINRQLFWARYVDWAITTPLLLLDLGILAGLSGAHILMAIIADIVMILMGLFSAMHARRAAKWGDYTIAVIAFLVVIWHLALNGRNAVKARSQKVGSFYTAIAAYTIVVWAAYPIIWGITEGGRHLSVNGEIIAYAVLDVLAKPVFGLWLLMTHAKTPETNVGLGGFWANGLNREGVLRLDEEEGA